MRQLGDQDRGSRRRGRTRSGGPLIGMTVTLLLLLTVALLLIVPLFSATRSLAQRRSVDRLFAATQLPAAIERAAAEAIEAALTAPPGAGDADAIAGAGGGAADAATDWREPLARARRIAARLAGTDGSATDEGPPAALSPLVDVPGGIDAAFAVLAGLDELAEAAAAAAAADGRPDDGGAAASDAVARIKDARRAVLAATGRLGDLLRRDTARGLAGLLRFDGGVLAAVVLLGLLQVALLVRLRRLNVGLHAEIERRTASEQRVRDREAELRKAADELRAARDDAEAADRAKSRFLATMSHEFRTPLNGILGFTWLIERNLAAGRAHELADDVRRIRGAGEHMLRLVSDVLDLAKIEAGMMHAAAAPCDAGALAREIAAAAEPLVAAGGSRFAVDVEPLGEARLDATRLRQVLDNLLSNAGRFTESGTVRFSARRLPAGTAWEPADEPERDPEAEPEDPAPLDPATDPAARHRVGHPPPADVDRLLFRVCDTGSGMNARELAGAFREFVQVDDSEQRRHGGTGLGLALVSRFAELLGGAVHVVSRPGRGTCCSLIVPAVMPAPATATPDPPADRAPRPEEPDR